jgi:hypothetical protein
MCSIPRANGDLKILWFLLTIRQSRPENFFMAKSKAERQKWDSSNIFRLYGWLWKRVLFPYDLHWGREILVSLAFLGWEREARDRRLREGHGEMFLLLFLKPSLGGVTFWAPTSVTSSTRCG